MRGTENSSPLFNHMDKLPALTQSHRHFLPRKACRRTSGYSLPVSTLGEAVLYECSFCTIINVQGRKRHVFARRTIFEKIIRENVCTGAFKRFFITDDNFARNQRLGDYCLIVSIHVAPKTEFPGLGFINPGRYAVPQNSEFHRKSRPSWRAPCFHRA